MPRLINYLNRAQPARFYDDAEMDQLQAIYDRARQMFDISIDDPRRERLAMLIFQEADGSDPDELLGRIAALFRQHG